MLDQTLRKRHIPVKVDDLDCISESQRETAANMAVWQCSNRNPAEADKFFFNVQVLRSLTLSRPSYLAYQLEYQYRLLYRPHSLQATVQRQLTCYLLVGQYVVQKWTPHVASQDYRIWQYLFPTLPDRTFFASKFVVHTELEPKDIFDDVQVWQVCKNYRQPIGSLTLDGIMGDEMIEGTYSNIMSTIEDWRDQLCSYNIRML